MGKHRFVIDGTTFDVEVHARDAAGADVTVNGRRVRVSRGELAAPGEKRRATSVASASPAAPRPRAATSGEVRAPMAGLVLSIVAPAGSHVSRGQPLLVLDAMKMENSLGSPLDGMVEQVAVKPGDTVLQGALLARVRGA